MNAVSNQFFSGSCLALQQYRHRNAAYFCYSFPDHLHCLGPAENNLVALGVRVETIHLGRSNFRQERPVPVLPPNVLEHLIGQEEKPFRSQRKANSNVQVFMLEEDSTPRLEGNHRLDKVMEVMMIRDKTIFTFSRFLVAGMTQKRD